MTKKLRLRQFLMKTGEFGRVEDATKAIKDGLVFVDGRNNLNPDFQLKKTQEVKLKVADSKKLLKLKESIYILFNKPAGVVCQKSDGEKTIYDLIEKIPELSSEEKKTLFSVGRLDKDTEGLLIVTNDGDLNNYLMRPDKHVPKTYLVEAEKPIDGLTDLEIGVDIHDDDAGKSFRVHAISTSMLGPKKAEITIDEGRKRQVKKMFEQIGNKVVSLKRVSIGKLNLDEIDFNGKNYLIVEKEFLKDKFV